MDMASKLFTFTFTSAFFPWADNLGALALAPKKCPAPGSTDTGAEVIMHLFSVMLLLPADAYPPRGVREWLSTTPKGQAQGNCPTDRPVTLHLVVDKLFAKLLSESFARAVCLPGQQYAFRPGRGMLNPLQNLLAGVRQRTQANQTTYACFDAATAHRTPAFVWSSPILGHLQISR